jgi:four helix bundle protein
MRGLQSLRVYNAAETFAVDIAHLLARIRLSANEASQLERSSGAISDLIAEGHGRGPGADRRRIYRIARGEAEESVNQLKKLVRLKRLTEQRFYPLFNRGLAIVKMLDKQIGD